MKDKEVQSKVMFSVTMILLIVAMIAISSGAIGKWADSLPPSPEEIRGEIPMGPRK